MGLGRRGGGRRCRRLREDSCQGCLGSPWRKGNLRPCPGATGEGSGPHVEGSTAGHLANQAQRAHQLPIRPTEPLQPGGVHQHAQHLRPPGVVHKSGDVQPPCASEAAASPAWMAASPAPFRARRSDAQASNPPNQPCCLPMQDAIGGRTMCWVVACSSCGGFASTAPAGRHWNSAGPCCIMARRGVHPTATGWLAEPVGA